MFYFFFNPEIKTHERKKRKPKPFRVWLDILAQVRKCVGETIWKL